MMPGQEIVVELKDDSEVRGVVEHCDQFMNISLLHAQLTFPDGHVDSFEEGYHVHGKAVRYVHLPRHVKPRAVVTAFVTKLDRLRKRSRPHRIVDRGKASDGSSAVEVEKVIDLGVSEGHSSSLR